MWAEFINLLAGYGAIPMGIICLGALLCIIEVFVPGFGFFGITGGIISVGGIIARMVMGASVIQLLYMVVMVVSLVVLSLLVMILLARLGLVKYSPLVERKTSVPENYGKDNKAYLKMLGKTTFADTDFKPSGKFTYNENIYEATTYGEFISKGDKIKIVEVKADTIYVKKI